MNWDILEVGMQDGCGVVHLLGTVLLKFNVSLHEIKIIRP